MKQLFAFSLGVLGWLSMASQVVSSFSAGLAFQPYPSDIIKLSDGSYTLVCGLASSQDLIENWYNHRLLANFDANADTLWTQIQPQNQGGNHHLLQGGEGYLGLGLTGVYSCGSVFVTSPNFQSHSVFWDEEGNESLSVDVGMGCSVNHFDMVSTDSTIYATQESVSNWMSSEVSTPVIMSLDQTGSINYLFPPVVSRSLDLDQDGILLQYNDQLHKIDVDGNLLWSTTLPGFVNENQVLVAGENSAIVYRSYLTGSPSSVQRVAYETGEQIWQTTLDFTLVEGCRHPAGVFLFVGFDEAGARAAALDMDGNLLWTNAWTSGLSAKLTALLPTEAGFVAAGQIKLAANEYEVLIIHSDEDQPMIGCMDESACNYMPSAVIDAGCTFPGCIDPEALNYDPNAGCAADLCMYEFGCPWDADGDGVVGTGDILEFLGALGEPAPTPFDTNGDGIVGFEDFLDALGAMGTECE